MTHVTTELLDRMARRDLTPEEFLGVARHLESCDDCARQGRERAARDLVALQEEFKPAPRSRRRIWLSAIAAALAVLLLALLFTRDDAPSERAPVVDVTDPPSRTAPRTATTPDAAAAYADPEWERLVAEAKRSGTLPFPPDLDALRGQEEILRGSSDESQRVSPAGIVIDETRPTFRWPARKAGRYTLFIFDGERQLASSGELDAPRWTAKSDLPRGRTLTWQVEVTDGERVETIPRPPAPPAMFRIATDAGHRDLVRALAAHPRDHLLHAVLYARAGMRREALEAMGRAKAK